MTRNKQAAAALLIAGVVAGAQALALGALGVADLLDLQEGRRGVGAGIGILLLVLALGLGTAAVAVARGRHGGRGPVMVAQLIALGLSWNLLRGDPNLPGTGRVGLVLGTSALVVLASLLTRGARAALTDVPADTDV